MGGEAGAAEPPGIGLLAFLLILGLAFVFEAMSRVGAAMGVLGRGK